MTQIDWELVKQLGREMRTLQRLREANPFAALCLKAEDE